MSLGRNVWITQSMSSKVRSSFVNIYTELGVILGSGELSLGLHPSQRANRQSHWDWLKPKPLILCCWLQKATEAICSWGK